MAIKKLSELKTVNSIQDTDLLVIETSNGTKTISVKNILPTTATQTSSGLMSNNDKTKLDGFEFATITEVETYLGV